MIIERIVIVLLAGILTLCRAQQFGSTSDAGFVVYPPYTNPYDASESNCKMTTPWITSQGLNYQKPAMTPSRVCRGSLSGLSFLLPESQPAPSQPPIETVYVNSRQNNIVLTCNNGAPGIYQWIYLYQSIGLPKSYSLQSTMAWDFSGRMVFQPFPHWNDDGNVTCRYYDPQYGYFVVTRTWKIDVRGDDEILPPSSHAVVYPCDRSSPASLGSGSTSVIVTSRRLDFMAVCPAVGCSTSQQNSGSDFGRIAYTTGLPSDVCATNPNDPGSYPTCSLDPMKSRLSYKCSLDPKQGSTPADVSVSLTSGARFADDNQFTILYVKEGQTQVNLPCNADPLGALVGKPKWEAMVGYNPTGYVPTAGLEVDNGRGQFKLQISTVKWESQGSYRCSFEQSIAGAGPHNRIYGYHFMKVYRIPICRAFDANSGHELLAQDGNVQIDLKVLSPIIINLECEQVATIECPLVMGLPNANCIKDPVAKLIKSGQSQNIETFWSNASYTHAKDTPYNGQPKIQIVGSGVNRARITVYINENGQNANNLEYVKGTYFVSIVYGTPANLDFSSGLTFYVAQPPPPPSGTITGPAGTGLWWIALIVAGVILIILILFVIGYCLRQSGQTYPVDKKERDAGRDPVKELKDSGFSDFAAHQPANTGSEPSMTGSVKLPEDSDSLGEYGEIDPTKFNEDGSFIHQYRNATEQTPALPVGVHLPPGMGPQNVIIQSRQGDVPHHRQFGVALPGMGAGLPPPGYPINSHGNGHAAIPPSTAPRIVAPPPRPERSGGSRLPAAPAGTNV